LDVRKILGLVCNRNALIKESLVPNHPEVAVSGKGIANMTRRYPLGPGFVTGLREAARATSGTGFDKGKLENGVLEPLKELGLIED